MTDLRKRMLEELQRRNYSPATIRGYLFAVSSLLNTSENPLTSWGRDELRSYQAYLIARPKPY